VPLHTASYLRVLHCNGAFYRLTGGYHGLRASPTWQAVDKRWQKTVIIGGRLPTSYQRRRLFNTQKTIRYITLYSAHTATRARMHRRVALAPDKRTRDGTGAERGRGQAEPGRNIVARWTGSAEHGEGRKKKGDSVRRRQTRSAQPFIPCPASTHTAATCLLPGAQAWQPTAGIREQKEHEGHLQTRRPSPNNTLKRQAIAHRDKTSRDLRAAVNAPLLCATR